MENFPEDGFIRERRPELVEKLAARRELENKLTNGELTPQRFLLAVSHSYDTVINDFHQYEAPDDPEEDEDDDEGENPPNPMPAPNNPYFGDCVVCLMPKDGIWKFNCNHAVCCSVCARRIIQDGQQTTEGPRCPVCRVLIHSLEQIFI